MRLKRIEKLILKSGSGDRAAFELLYDKTAPKLFAVILHILKNREPSENALEDVYANIWNEARFYKKDGRDPMAWLISLTRDTAIAQLRQQKGRIADLSALQGRIDLHNAHTSIRASIPAEVKRMPKCMASLEKERAAAIRGVYLEGTSYADVALRFEIPLDEVRAWFGTSLLTLKKCLRS